MLRYTNQEKKQFIIGVMDDQLTPHLAALTEKLLAVSLELTGSCPAVGDLLEPVQGTQLAIINRKYEMQDSTFCIWFYTRAVPRH